MNSAIKLKTLLSSLSLALVAAAPLARAQDAAPAAAPAPATAPAAAPDAAPAPDAPPPPRRAKGKGKGMPNALDQVSNVTADQRAKADKIRAEARAKIEALPEDDRREQMRPIMKDASDKVRALLTADQQTEYDAAVKKMMRGRGRKKAPDGDAGAPPPPPPQN